MSATAVPASSEMRRTPTSTPSDGSPGVDGVFTRCIAPLSSWTRRRSVNVPPTSTPSLCAIRSSCSAGDRGEDPGAIDLTFELSLEHSLQPLRHGDEAGRDRCRSRCLLRGAGRRDPRSRCCPSRAGRRGSRRCRLRRHPTPWRPPRPQRKHSRTPCCACCADGRRRGTKAPKRPCPRARAPVAARPPRPCLRTPPRRPRRPRDAARARAPGQRPPRPRTGSRMRSRSSPSPGFRPHGRARRCALRPAAESSTVVFWLRWLNVSDAANAMCASSRPVSTSRS